MTLKQVLMLLFISYLPLFLTAQDDAPEQRILEIRAHYQEVNNNPNDYEKRQLSSEMTVYLKDKKPHKIVMTNEVLDEVVEYYFDGDIEALNFVYAVVAGQQNRYYFSNAIGFPMKKPMLCRWIDENKKHYRYNDKGFVKKGVAMSAKANAVYFEAKMRLEWGNEKYEKIRARMDEIENYTANVKSSKELTDLAMPEGTGFAPPKPVEEGPAYDPDTGEPLFDPEYETTFYSLNEKNQIVKKECTGGTDSGCSFASAYKEISYFKEGRLIYHFKNSISQNYGVVIDNFNLLAWEVGAVSIDYYFGTEDMPVLRRKQFIWNDTAFDKNWKILNIEEVNSDNYGQDERF